MKENFKLSELSYSRIRIEDFEKEAENIITKFKEAKSGEEQFSVHKEYYTLIKKVRTTMTLAGLRFNGDMSNKFYEEEQNYYDEIAPKIESFEAKYKKLIFKSNFRPYLEEKLGEVAFKNIELQLKSFDDVLIPLKQEENALVSKYNKLIAQTTMEFRGETLSLSLLQKYLQSNDRATRIEASKVRDAKLLTMREELDSIFDALVKNRDAQAKAMNYKDFVELGYYSRGRNSYGTEEVKSFRNQVKKYLVPFASELHDERRERLGLDTLDFVDEGVYFLNGNPKPTGTPDEIFEAGKKMYNELSPETSEFFNFMIEHELFDVLGRPNKMAGGYMDMLPDYKAPIIFANFNGTSGDIDVLTHECGHAFQGFVTRDYEILEHNDITMETAEVHSMSMEFFTSKWMDLFFGDRAYDFKKVQFESAIQFIPYGCMVDEYQEIVYSNPNLTPDERREVWRKLEKEYKPHLKFEYDEFFGEGRKWQTQKHIYNYPFYYIDYCLAQICAIQFKVKMEENFTEAWDKYLELCKESAKGYFAEMLNKVGLRSPFEDGFIKELINNIKK